MHRYVATVHTQCKRLYDTHKLLHIINRLWLTSPKILAFDWQIRTGVVSCKSLVSPNWYPTFTKGGGKAGCWVGTMLVVIFFHDFREAWTWCRVHGSQHGSEAGSDWDGKTDVMLLHPNIWSQGNIYSVQDLSINVLDLFSKTPEIDASCLAPILA